MIIKSAYIMPEGVQYKSHFDWIIAGARVSYYVHGHYDEWSLMPGHLPKNKEKILP